MVSLAPLDWAVFGLFLAGILALGFSARLRSLDALNFIAAGRTLTLPLFVATLVSTWYGGILAIGESVQYFGVGTWLLLGVPYWLFALVYALFYARKVREADQISIPERLENTYGKGPGLLGAGFVFLLALPAAHVAMLGLFVELFTGWGALASMVAATAVGTAFLYKGGLLADARASILAFVMMYMGFAAIVVHQLVSQPVTGAEFATIEASLRQFDGSTSIPFVLTFFILGAWTLIDPGFHQRVSSAVSPEVGRKGVLVSILFWMVFDLLTVSTGLLYLMRGQGLAENPLATFPLFGDAVLPPGLKGVFFCGMIGTILSAMVGYALVSGSSFGRDLVARAKGARAEVLWTRIGIAVASVLAIALAMLFQGSVVNLWYSWGGAIIGAVLVPVSLSYLAPQCRIPATWVMAAMSAGFAAAFGLMLWGLGNENPYLTFQVRGYDIQVGTLLPGLVISGLLTWLGATLGAKRNGRPNHA